jgi:hypothetical protein
MVGFNSNSNNEDKEGMAFADRAFKSLLEFSQSPIEDLCVIIEKCASPLSRDQLITLPTSPTTLLLTPTTFDTYQTVFDLITDLFILQQHTLPSGSWEVHHTFTLELADPLLDFLALFIL